MEAKLWDSEAECPRCGSPHPRQHPAVQEGGEIEVCRHAFHALLTPNDPGYPGRYEASK
jgi:hypothetical protein